MPTYRKLTEVTSADALSAGARLIAEDGGALVRVPKSAAGLSVADITGAAEATGLSGAGTVLGVDGGALVRLPGSAVGMTELDIAGAEAVIALSGNGKLLAEDGGSIVRVPASSFAASGSAVDIQAAVEAVIYAPSAVSVTAINTGWEYSANGSTWAAVTLPHTCNASDAASASMARGMRYYRRTLTIAKGDIGKRYILRFPAAGQHTGVKINGIQVKDWAGGYVPFEADISDYIATGANTVLVTCDNSWDIELIPVSWDYNCENGLYRGAELIVQDKLAFDACAYGMDRLHVMQSAVSASAATLTVKARISNYTPVSKSAAVTCTLTDADGASVGTGSADYTVAAGGYTDTAIAITLSNPHLWAGLSDPYMYTMTAVLTCGGITIDTISAGVGVRYFALSTTAFTLNGVTTSLRGVALHEDSSAHAQAMTVAEVDADYALLTDIGCNFVRLAHYPHQKYALDKCDELGLIVQTEIPWVNHCGVNATDKYFTRIKANAESMIRNCYNHPSILFWGMFNEIGGSHYYAPGASATSDPQGGYSESKAKGWVAELAPYMRGLLEDGRFVGGAVNDRAFSDMANAATWDIDYIGINRYDGWYGGTFAHFGSRMTNAHTSDIVHPYAVTEYGAGANPLTHSETPLTTTDTGSGGARHDEEFQNLFHESYVEQIQARSWLCFTAVWAFIDFAVAARNEGGTPYINDKGLVTRDRATKKDAYFLYKALWRASPVAYITSRRFTQRTATSIAVKCYANTDTLTLAIDGVDVQTLTAATKCGVIWEFTAAAFAVGEHTVSVRGSKGGVQTTDSVTFEVVTVTPVSVATQPADVSGAIGTNAVYTVTATGTGVFTYQWQYSSDGTIWSASTLTGYSTATFTVPITAARDGNQYRCVISDGYGNSAVSNGAYLHVAAGALSISSQPASASGAIGASVTLTVAATGGTSPYTYLWQYYDTATSAWVSAGCTIASYALTVSAANDGVGYRCIVSDSASGSVTSSTATVTMAAADEYTELGTLSGNSSSGTLKAWYSVNLAAGTYQYRVVTTGSTPNSAITTVLCRMASSGSDTAGTALFSYTGNQTTNGQTLTGTFTLSATAPYLYFAFTPNTGSTFAATLSIIE